MNIDYKDFDATKANVLSSVYILASSLFCPLIK